MSSIRYPGKVLASLGGKPMLAHVVDRVGRARGLDGVVVATSADASDDPIADFCTRQGVRCWRGELHDVAARFIAAMHDMDIEVAARVSADSPFIDAALIDRAVDLSGDGVDLVTNVLARSFPRGQSVELIARAALDDAYTRMSEPAHFEHVTRYFYEHPEEFEIRTFESGADLGHLSLVVDTEKDLRNASAIMRRMNSPSWAYGCDEVVRLLRETQAESAEGST